MPHRLRFLLGFLALLVLTALVIWQGSFTLGDYGPSSTEQTYVFWGLSTLIFLLTVLLGFMLFRDAVKLYIARRAGVEGSRIRTKIVVGALTLTFLPTVFLVLWSVEVLNRNLDKWFSRPAESIRLNFADIASSMQMETQRKSDAMARWIADSQALRDFMRTGSMPADFFRSVCENTGVEQALVLRPDGGQINICENNDPQEPRAKLVEGKAPVANLGQVVVRSRMPADLDLHQKQLTQQIREYDQLTSRKKETRRFYLQLLLLITTFVLFIATWVALFLARQITGPVTALLEAARAVRGGNLGHRVQVAAIDELASLVVAFNEMTQDLEANRDELNRRRRFIEAVLESIPSGVISLDPDGSIHLVNSAMAQILPRTELTPGAKLSELIPPQYQLEFSRLLKRARRTGSASRQVEFDSPEGVRMISVTVAALDARVTSGFVMVLEDTSELLRAQKAAAWHEVARRIAHELKNPLTPIALSSQRILRQMERTQAPPEVRRIIQDCCQTILREVDSVKTLVDEFSQFARWPTAQPEPADLNQVVEEALAVFHGRLDSIQTRVSLAPNLPQLSLDREQFKRVIVNLVDNAAEAMAEAPVKQLYISTQSLTPEVVELIVADTGCGITTEDKERLFLPYFSTKQRGTGLGLAIVSHILGEHHAQIRVESNSPSGARFIIEIPAPFVPDSETRPMEVPA